MKLDTVADPGFEIPRLADYLQRNLEGFVGGLTVQRFQGGQSNPTFLLNAGTTRYVLRKKPSGHLLPSAHAVEREYRVLSALAETDVPVPSALCLCEDSSVIGTPFYVMSYAEGRIIYDPALPGMTNDERTAVYADMNRVIAALHRLDYNSVGLSGFGRSGNYLERQISRWVKQYRASETERIVAMENLIGWLPAHIPSGAGLSIVHGDYRLDNLVLDPREPRVMAVLDWELSTLGDPLADLAFHMQTWRLTASQFRGMADKKLTALGIPTEAEYLATYYRATGRAPVDPQTWEFYMTFSMFRLAAILQGILKRALDGNAADARAHETGRRGRLMSEIAWQNVTTNLRA
jgi:aminoglycoside phosphotransferase (APT) family kinase protein